MCSYRRLIVPYIAQCEGYFGAVRAGVGISGLVNLPIKPHKGFFTFLTSLLTQAQI